jgi:hypothetical protein
MMMYTLHTLLSHLSPHFVWIYIECHFLSHWLTWYLMTWHFYKIMYKPIIYTRVRGTNHLCNEKQFIKASIQYMCTMITIIMNNNSNIIKVNKHFDSFLRKCLQTYISECFVELISFLVIRSVVIYKIVNINTWLWWIKFKLFNGFLEGEWIWKEFNFFSSFIS